MSDLKVVGGGKGTSDGTGEMYEPWDLGNLKQIDLKWLAKPWILRDGLSMLVGSGGARKSWLALDLSLALATGGPWLGSTTNKCRVAYFDEDGSEPDALRRFKRLCDGRKLNQRDPELAENFRMFPSTGMRVDIKADREKLVETLIYNQIDYVVLDALVALHTLDENSNRDMRRIMRDIFRGIMRKAGVGMLIIHHKGKPSESHQMWSKVEKSRGATEITNSVDCALDSTQYGESDGISMLQMIRNKCISSDMWPSSMDYHLVDDQAATYIQIHPLQRWLLNGTSQSDIAERLEIAQSYVSQLIKATKIGVKKAKDL